MRSLQLEAALTDYIAAAAEHLQGEIAAGAEVPFELEQQGSGRLGRGPALYCYRPMTATFIEERRVSLQALPGYAEAVALLGSFDGLGRYLAAVGAEVDRLDAGARAGTALGSLLGEVFEEQSDFELNPERLQSALGRLERAATLSASDLTIVATLHGVAITSQELTLASGLVIAQPSALDGLPAAAKDGDADDAHLVVVLACSDQGSDEGIAHGRGTLRELLRALRLFGDGRVALGSMAWVRVGGGSWSPIALGEGGRPHGMLVITADQEDELRAFCNLVSRRAPHGNELAWALHRFELACGRRNVYDALSDNLMALRALLEPEGPASGKLPGRLAALCATPQRRVQLTQRTIQALALERAVIAGVETPSASSEALARDIADHLRALLRDVICGHLTDDLVGLADEILLTDLEPQAAPDGEAGGATAGVGADGVASTAPAAELASLEQEAPDVSIEQALSDASESDEVLDLLI